MGTDRRQSIGITHQIHKGRVLRYTSEPCISTIALASRLLPYSLPHFKRTASKEIYTPEIEKPVRLECRKNTQFEPVRIFDLLKYAKLAPRIPARAKCTGGKRL